MPDIGLNPPGTRHDRVVGGVASIAGLKFGNVVVMDVAAAGFHRAVTATTTPGGGPLAGVITSQTDPVNGTAIGDNLEICDEGIVEVWLVSGQAIVKGDLLVASATAGMVTKHGAETTPWILGIAFQDMASQSAPVRIAAKLGIYQHA
jgi:Uncharacterized conserved protein (DUF2190)